MTRFEVPKLIPRPTPNPEPSHPGLDRKIGEVTSPREMTASKKVDDISRHESRHDMVPKHEPKLNPRENAPEQAKPGQHPQGSKPTPDPAKK